jgi:molybdopterin molybdotransferase
MTKPPRPSVDEALAIIRASTNLVTTQVVATTDSSNRVTAECVRAVRDVPSFRTAAMDGFAVRTADIANGEGVSIVGTVAAGNSSGNLRAGTAIAISTGAPIPAGADRVIPREHARTSGDILRVDQGGEGSNIRNIGEDMRAGAALFESGQPITPDALGAMVACGCDEVTVRRRPRLAVLSTGTELMASSGDARISDSNRPMIVAAARDLGLEVSWSSVTSDHPNLLEDAIDQTAETDLIVSTGARTATCRDRLARHCDAAREADAVRPAS